MSLKVRIHEAGKSQLEKLDKTVVKSYNPKDEESPIYKKSLRSVFNALVRHKQDKKIKAANLPKGIFPETLDYTKSFLIARLPGLYADNIGGWPRTTHDFLIDENISKHTNVDIWADFGRATHTDFEELSGKKDDKVWRWAVKNKVSGIITRDRRMSEDGEDLGLIALRHAHDLLKKRKKVQYPVDMPNMPLLIQIDSTSRKSISTLMRLHQDEIIKHLDKRDTPYIFLTETDCVKGPSYSDVARYDWTTIRKMASDIIAKTKLKYPEQDTNPQSRPSASPS